MFSWVGDFNDGFGVTDRLAVFFQAGFHTLFVLKLDVCESTLCLTIEVEWDFDHRDRARHLGKVRLDLVFSNWNWEMAYE